ncbi:hypothetical protein [Krasilnikovia sp. MM14-A1259]|uniref:hypothetical protein n=1 Tax=Krasilnikovia sp. MM14-A1259 TaxID=3373539 RepID=UPI0038194243
MPEPDDDDGLVPPMKVLRRRLNGVYRADGLSAPTRRYILIVVLLVGLASLPTLAAITAGRDYLGRDRTGAMDVPLLPPPSGGQVVPAPGGVPQITPQASADAGAQPAPSETAPSASATPPPGDADPGGERATGAAGPSGSSGSSGSEGGHPESDGERYGHTRPRPGGGSPTGTPGGSPSGGSRPGGSPSGGGKSGGSPSGGSPSGGGRPGGSPGAGGPQGGGGEPGVPQGGGGEPGVPQGGGGEPGVPQGGDGEPGVPQGGDGEPGAPPPGESGDPGTPPSAEPGSPSAEPGTPPAGGPPTEPGTPPAEPGTPSPGNPDTPSPEEPGPPAEPDPSGHEAPHGWPDHPSEPPSWCTDDHRCWDPSPETTTTGPSIDNWRSDMAERPRNLRTATAAARAHNSHRYIGYGNGCPQANRPYWGSHRAGDRRWDDYGWPGSRAGRHHADPDDPPSWW